MVIGLYSPHSSLYISYATDWEFVNNQELLKFVIISYIFMSFTFGEFYLEAIQFKSVFITITTNVRVV